MYLIKSLYAAKHFRAYVFWGKCGRHYISYNENDTPDEKWISQNGIFQWKGIQCRFDFIPERMLINNRETILINKEKLKYEQKTQRLKTFEPSLSRRTR